MKFNYDKSNDPRVLRLKKINDMVYFWSIKHQKLLKLRNYKFKKGRKCQLCIPKFTIRNGFVPCKFRYSSFSKVKRHFLNCENKFGRQLIWANRSEIPQYLRRDRELGDLSSFLDAQKIRIEFDTVTLVKSKVQLMEYFNANPCPCQNNKNIKCKVDIKCYKTLLRHLITLELKQKRYFIFKVDSTKYTLDGQLVEELSESEFSELKSSDSESDEDEKLFCKSRSKKKDKTSLTSTFMINNDREYKSRPTNFSKTSNSCRPNTNKINMNNKVANKYHLLNKPCLPLTKMKSASSCTTKKLSNKNLTSFLINNLSKSDQQLQEKEYIESRDDFELKKIEKVTQINYVCNKILNELNESSNQNLNNITNKLECSDSEDEEELINSIYLAMKPQIKNEKIK